MPDLTALERRIVAAAKRWYGAVALDERAGASVALRQAIQALLKTEAEAKGPP